MYVYYVHESFGLYTFMYITCMNLLVVISIPRNTSYRQKVAQEDCVAGADCR